jgi:hypothetical protein
LVMSGKASWPASIPVYDISMSLRTVYSVYTHLILVDRVKELVIVLTLGGSCGSA